MLLMTAFKRITLTIDPTLLSRIDHVSALMGVSRSAFVSQLLTDTVGEMYDFLESVQVPDDPDAARMRGRSAEYVQHRIEELMTTIDSDLFGGRS